MLHTNQRRDSIPSRSPRFWGRKRRGSWATTRMWKTVPMVPATRASRLSSLIMESQICFQYSVVKEVLRIRTRLDQALQNRFNDTLWKRSKHHYRLATLMLFPGHNLSALCSLSLIQNRLLIVLIVVLLITALHSHHEWRHQRHINRRRAIVISRRRAALTVRLPSQRPRLFLPRQRASAVFAPIALARWIVAWVAIVVPSPALAGDQTGNVPLVVGHVGVVRCFVEC